MADSVKTALSVESICLTSTTHTDDILSTECHNVDAPVSAEISTEELYRHALLFYKGEIACQQSVAQTCVRCSVRNSPIFSE